MEQRRAQAEAYSQSKACAPMSRRNIMEMQCKSAQYLSATQKPRQADQLIRRWRKMKSSQQQPGHLNILTDFVTRCSSDSPRALRLCCMQVEMGKQCFQFSSCLGGFRFRSDFEFKFGS